MTTKQPITCYFCGRAMPQHDRAVELGWVLGFYETEIFADRSNSPVCPECARKNPTVDPKDGEMIRVVD